MLIALLLSALVFHDCTELDSISEGSSNLSKAGTDINDMTAATGTQTSPHEISRQHIKRPLPLFSTVGKKNKKKTNHLKPQYAFPEVAWNTKTISHI